MVSLKRRLVLPSPHPLFCFSIVCASHTSAVNYNCNIILGRTNMAKKSNYSTSFFVHASERLQSNISTQPNDSPNLCMLLTLTHDPTVCVIGHCHLLHKRDVRHSCDTRASPTCAALAPLLGVSCHEPPCSWFFVQQSQPQEPTPRVCSPYSAPLSTDNKQLPLRCYCSSCSYQQPLQVVKEEH